MTNSRRAEAAFLWPALLLISAGAYAGGAPPPSKQKTAEPVPPTVQEVIRIEARARQIAGYERAAIRATDLLLAKNPDRSKMGVYVAVHSNKAWTVYFGKLSADRMRFATAYAYSCPDTAFKEMKAIKVQAVASKGPVELARATQLALKSISKEAKFRLVSYFD